MSTDINPSCWTCGKFILPIDTTKPGATCAPCSASLRAQLAEEQRRRAEAQDLIVKHRAEFNLCAVDTYGTPSDEYFRALVAECDRFLARPAVESGEKGTT